jgi:hypothetical protein
VERNVSREQPTKDLRYESKDSRDMEKCSLSVRPCLWLDGVLDPCDLCQKLFFSGGEGYCTTKCKPLDDVLFVLARYRADKYELNIPEGKHHYH